MILFIAFLSIIILILSYFFNRTVFIILLLILSYSYFIERNSFIINHQKIKLSCISKEIDKKIIHISDLHFNAKTSKKWINNILKTINDLKPEAVFITGDIIDNENGIKIAGDFVKNINSNTYIVFGNWDYYALKYNVSKLQKELELLSNATILINQSKVIKIAGENFRLIGIKDPYTSKDTKKDITNSVENIPNNEKLCKILLTHSPEAIKYILNKDIKLVFAGHTHGGQVYLPVLTKMLLPIGKFGKKYVRGYYKENDLNIYINQGLGTSTLPLRFLRPPEITIISFTN